MKRHRGIHRYRPRISNELTVRLLTYDAATDEEVEVPVTVYVDDWYTIYDKTIDKVMLYSWDIKSLLSDDEMQQIYSAVIEHKEYMADYFEAAEEDYGDYLMEINRDE